MVTLASDFAPLGSVAAWLLLVVMSIASAVLSARAHWSGLLLALPGAAFNLLLDRSIAAGYGMGEPTLPQWLMFLAPMILSAASVGLWIWAIRRRRARGRAEG